MSGRVLITGAASGIGAATCRRFAENGWDVIPLDKEWPTGTPAGALTEDVADADSLRHALREVGRLDALINNAAVHDARPIADIDPQDFSRVLDVNLRAAALLTQACTPALIRSRGSIVNVSSVHAVASGEGMAAYAASKAGLVALTRVTAVELGSHGVRANAVLPGAVDTPMLFPGASRREREAGVESLSARTPLGRVGAPREIAAAIAFLCDTEAAGFISGAALRVDGGATARLGSE